MFDDIKKGDKVFVYPSNKDGTFKEPVLATVNSVTKTLIKVEYGVKGVPFYKKNGFHACSNKIELQLRDKISKLT
jgi:hypothetical protein